MVKKGMFRVLFAAAALSVASCASNGDIDDLNDRLGELDKKIEQLEEQQQQALLAEIAQLQAQIVSLQGDLTDLEGDVAADYAELLASLTDLEAEVESGAKVHYGSILTADDLAAFVAEEATIVTGDVVITSDDQLTSLVNLTTIGGNLLVKGGTNVTLANLESVSGNVIVEGMNTTDGALNLPMLKAVGYSLEVVNNVGLATVNMPELLLVNGNLEVTENADLKTLTFMKLDMVAGNLNVTNYNEMDPNFAGYSIETVDFSSASVMGDASIEYLSVNTELMLGDVKGSVSVMNTGSSKLEVTSSKLAGSVVLERNAKLAEVLFPNLTEIMGSIRVYYNVAQSFLGPGVGELKGLSCFDNVTMIGGDVYVVSNDFEDFDGFNNVEKVGGISSEGDAFIHLEQNGHGKSLVNVFNKLTGVAGGWGKIDIKVHEKAEWFNGFEVLTRAGVLDVLVQRTLSEAGSGDVAKMDGFDALTEIKAGSSMDLSKITEFNAFPVLESVYDIWRMEDGQDYFTMNAPEDHSVKLCNLNVLLTNINADQYPFNGGTAKFVDWTVGWPGEVDAQYILDTYLDTCE